MIWPRVMRLYAELLAEIRHHSYDMSEIPNVDLIVIERDTLLTALERFKSGLKRELKEGSQVVSHTPQKA